MTTETPERCFVLVPGAAPGNRVAIAKRGEHGYYLTDLDSHTETGQQLQTTVDKMNERLGVGKAEAQAMLYGSVLGWHVQAADSHYWRDLENGA
jgi:hypothetical protein